MRTAFNVYVPGDRRIAGGVSDLGSVFAHAALERQKMAMEAPLMRLKMMEMQNQIRNSNAANARAEENARYTREAISSRIADAEQKRQEVEAQRAYNNRVSQDTGEYLKTSMIPLNEAHAIATGKLDFSNGNLPGVSSELPGVAQQNDSIGNLISDYMSRGSGKMDDMAKQMVMLDALARNSGGRVLNNDALYNVERLGGVNPSAGVDIADRNQLLGDKAAQAIALSKIIHKGGSTDPFAPAGAEPANAVPTPGAGTADAGAGDGSLEALLGLLAQSSGEAPPITDAGGEAPVAETPEAPAAEPDQAGYDQPTDATAPTDATDQSAQLFPNQAVDAPDISGDVNLSGLGDAVAEKVAPTPKRFRLATDRRTGHRYKVYSGGRVERISR